MNTLWQCALMRCVKQGFYWGHQGHSISGAQKLLLGNDSFDISPI